MRNAFAFIVQARPGPTFGRPVRLRGSPHRLQPGTSPHALRIPPRDGHPALRSTAKWRLQVHLGCIWLSLSCPCRLLHTFLSLRPARHYPRFWIRRPSSGRQRDFNPPERRAAQRTLWRSPTSPARARPPFGLWPSRTGLDPSTKTHKRSPGSRACCFSACAGSTDYAGPDSYSRLA
jgi:hypothetical protein